MVAIDYSISIGNMVQIAVIATGGFGAFVAMRLTVNNLKSDVRDLQSEVKQIGSVLINMADMRGEIRVLDTRMAAAEQDVRDLQRGEGFVRGPRGIEREYP